jgi:hypothetical protein
LFKAAYYTAVGKCGLRREEIFIAHSEVKVGRELNFGGTPTGLNRVNTGL